jgi:guanylate kinase
MTLGNPASSESATPFGLVPAGFLLVISGPSGVGKGTLVERLLAARRDCVLSISDTTRPRRPGETDGVQYGFLSREEFERRRAAGWFLEWAEVHGHLYGTPAAFVEREIEKGRVVVLEVDVQGGASVRRAQSQAVSVFLCPPSLEALRQRLMTRHTDPPEVVERRLVEAPRELAQYREYDYLILNDDRDQATARLVGIVDAERARVRRLVAADLRAQNPQGGVRTA